MRLKARLSDDASERGREFEFEAEFEAEMERFSDFSLVGEAEGERRGRMPGRREFIALRCTLKWDCFRFMATMAGYGDRKLVVGGHARPGKRGLTFVEDHFEYRALRRLNAIGQVVGYRHK